MKSYLHVGDCIALMRYYGENTFDCCITDPPYGINFSREHKWDMNKNIDFHQAWAQEVLRILKPGSYFVSFAGARTEHIIGYAFEAVGFTIKDSIVWTYKTGYPKNHDSEKTFLSWHADELAKKWKGWGTALKPAFESIIIAQKPYKGRLHDSVERWGVGLYNIDALRIEGAYPSTVIECKKPTLTEKNLGCEALPLRNDMRVNAPRKNEAAKRASKNHNHHPTTKPVQLMKRLIALVTPPNGRIIDPFVGSGTTLVAAANMNGVGEGVGIEISADYAEIASHRLGLQKRQVQLPFTANFQPAKQLALVF